MRIEINLEELGIVCEVLKEGELKERLGKIFEMYNCGKDEMSVIEGLRLLGCRDLWVEKMLYNIDLEEEEEFKEELKNLYEEGLSIFRKIDREFRKSKGDRKYRIKLSKEDIEILNNIMEDVIGWWISFRVDGSISVEDLLSSVKVVEILDEMMGRLNDNWMSWDKI